MLRTIFTLCLLPSVLVVHAEDASDDAVARGDTVVFEKHVRPILKAHCFHCHGEAGEKEGGLDLRLRRLIVAGGESGAAIVPTRADESLLLEKVRSGDMPPGDDKRLSTKQIQTLEAWIAGGAVTARDEPEDVGDDPIFTDEERSYWAFQPVERPDVPTLQNTARQRTAIDAFIQARDSQLADDADRERLIRRAYFDLVGLPPTPDAVDAFVADTRPDAWERLIDELLQSPHYGERWGRHWLDVAGYADSEGYTDEDRVRPHAWRYRDYVIRSFNDDKPFDVFVQEQLAGDEMVPRPHENLSHQDIDRLTATGFLRMAPDGTASGDIDKALAQNQVIADTLQIVGTSLLGLTINCAQCHDHRYDPIPTRDYYRLRAIFEPAFDVTSWRTPAGRQISLYTDADRQLAAAIENEAKAVDEQRRDKVQEYITRTLEEELLLVPEAKRSDLRTAYRTAAKERNDVQQALLKDYPSVASISEGSLYLYDRRRAERAAKIDADRKQKLAGFIAAANSKTGAAAAKGVVVTEANLADFDPDAAAELQRLAREAQQLRDSKAADDLKTYSDKAAEIRNRKPVEGFVRSLTEVPGRVPATFVFYRGDHEQPKQEVLPGTLSILPTSATMAANDEALPTTGRRLAFARHLTNGKHPLFARVIVNRIWMHHFGRGLVATAGDFGLLGTPPTHPKLLDWLAAEFVDSGFRIKHMHRLIMRSSVYRQAPAADASSGAVSYVGYPLRRLESEIIRDAVLSVSGLLNTKAFGEPVPVMEDGVGQIVIGRENLDGERKPTGAVSLDGEEYRRSIYVQVRRSRTLSMFETFDAPALSPNCDSRSFSTATPQSLLMMNSDFAITFADAFAGRILTDTDGDAAAVSTAWKLAFGTTADDTDVQQAISFLTDLSAQIKAKDAQATDEQIRREAVAVFCQALLSSNRFLYVE
ncbi:MAG: PSD1 and planctomycete cytochrome C domain-containing protein [Planctomycetaceae bacterium]